MPSRLRLDYLDGFRAALALIVVLDHMYTTVWRLDAHRLPDNALYPLRYLSVIGSLCVGGFLVISGFCLMMPVVRNQGVLTGGAARFYKRRIRRILPPYYFALGFALLPQMSHGIQAVGWWNLFSHIFLVHNFSTTTLIAINAAFWSIAVECQVYLLFPLLIACWNRYGKSATLLGLGLLGAADFLILQNTVFQGVSLYLYLLFGLGMASAYIVFSQTPTAQAWRERGPWGWVCLAALAAVGILLHLWGQWVTLARYVPELDWLAGLAMSAALVMGARSKPPAVIRWLSCRPLVGIGSFSYSLYLIHFPLITMLEHRLQLRMPGRETAHFAILIAVLPLLVLAAFVFFWFCERPFMPGRVTTERRAETAAIVSPAP